MDDDSTNERQEDSERNEPPSRSTLTVGDLIAADEVVRQQESSSQVHTSDPSQQPSQQQGYRATTEATPARLGSLHPSPSRPHTYGTVPRVSASSSTNQSNLTQLIAGNRALQDATTEANRRIFEQLQIQATSQVSNFNPAMQMAAASFNNPQLHLNNDAFSQFLLHSFGLASLPLTMGQIHDQANRQLLEQLRVLAAARQSSLASGIAARQQPMVNDALIQQAGLNVLSQISTTVPHFETQVEERTSRSWHGNEANVSSNPTPSVASATRNTTQHSASTTSAPTGSRAKRKSPPVARARPDSSDDNETPAARKRHKIAKRHSSDISAPGRGANDDDDDERKIPAEPRQSRSTSSSASYQSSRTLPMALNSDRDELTEYQCLIRQQVSFFEATPADVHRIRKGRCRPIQVGQVGIICRHCLTVHPNSRERGSVYFPSKLDLLYQSVQNMVSNHLLESCTRIPSAVRARLLELKEEKSPAPGGGKAYWINGALVLGIKDSDQGLQLSESLVTLSNPTLTKASKG